MEEHKTPGWVSKLNKQVQWIWFAIAAIVMIMSSESHSHIHFDYKLEEQWRTDNAKNQDAIQAQVEKIKAQQNVNQDVIKSMKEELATANSKVMSACLKGRK